MTDLDTKLRKSLDDAGKAFSPKGERTPSFERFQRARRRRMAVRGAGTLALIAALVGAALFIIPTESTVEKPVPIGPGPVPEGPTEITARLDVASQPRGVAVDDERVIVGHAEEKTITFVDASNTETSEIPLDFGSAPYVAAEPGLFVTAHADYVQAFSEVGEAHSIGFDRYGNPSAVEIGGGSIWVATSKGGKDGCCLNQIVRLSGEDLSSRETYPTSDSITGAPTYPNIDYGYGALWVGTNGGRTDGLRRIDAESGEVATIPGVRSTSDVAVGPTGVWVYENSSKQLRSRVLRIDPETLEVEEVATVLGYFAWLEADENGVWVLNASDETDRRLLRLDPETGDSMGTSIRLGVGPFEMTSGFGSIWITDEGKAQLLRVDVVEGDSDDEAEGSDVQEGSGDEPRSVQVHSVNEGETVWGGKLRLLPPGDADPTIDADTALAIADRKESESAAEAEVVRLSLARIVDERKGRSDADGRLVWLVTYDLSCVDFEGPDSECPIHKVYVTIDAMTGERVDTFMIIE